MASNNTTWVLGHEMNITLYYINIKEEEETNLGFQAIAAF
jgi:hypothetical protein